MIEVVKYSGQHQQEALRVRRCRNKQDGDIVFKSSLNGIKDFWIMIATNPSLCVTGKDLMGGCHIYPKMLPTPTEIEILSVLARRTGSPCSLLSSVRPSMQSPLRAFTSNLLPPSALTYTHRFTRTDESRCSVEMRLDNEQLILYFQKSTQFRSKTGYSIYVGAIVPRSRWN